MLAVFLDAMRALVVRLVQMRAARVSPGEAIGGAGRVAVRVGESRCASGERHARARSCVRGTPRIQCRTHVVGERRRLPHFGRCEARGDARLRSSDRAESCERLMLARRLGLPAPGPPCINPKTDIVRTKPPTTAPSSCSRKK